MNDEWLAEIKARAERATPGPWEVLGETMHGSPGLACEASCGLGLVPKRIERAGDVEGFSYLPPDTKIHVLVGEEVEDVIGPDGQHVVCLGGHDYDDKGVMDMQDAEFIAHARTDVPALIAEIERLKGKHK